MIPVLYEDEQFVVFNKPSGVLVTPSPGKTKNILTEIVNVQYQVESMRLHPCHRLDLETSGVIIYAKGKRNQQTMMALFQHGDVEKIYVAFVKGRVKQTSGTLTGKIQDYHQKKFAAHSRAKSAVTAYKVIGYGKGFSIIQVKPETGRTNQIRIHFAQSGHPLLGERVYAFRKDFDVDMKRLALHASSVCFIHPITGKKILVKAGLSDDMKEFLRRLKMNDSNVDQLISKG